MQGAHLTLSRKNPIRSAAILYFPFTELNKIEIAIVIRNLPVEWAVGAVG